MDEGISPLALALKWNNHNKTFLKAFSDLYYDDRPTYSDVTLACDGKYYRVHKIVLSICSDYFKDIFKQIQCQHPIIVLKDLEHEYLEVLINYMYVGEASVLQTDLSKLIKAAECLKIKGLAVPDEPVSTIEKKRHLSGELISPKRKRTAEDLVFSLGSDNAETTEDSSPNNLVQKEEIEEDFHLHREEVYVKEEEDEVTGISGPDPSYLTPVGTTEVPDEDETHIIGRVIGHSDETLECDPLPIPSSSGVAEVEAWNSDQPNYSYNDNKGKDEPAKAPSTDFVCPYCTKELYCKSKYERHIITHTGEKPFRCPFCPHRGTRKFSVRNHIEKFHNEELDTSKSFDLQIDL